MPKKSKVGQMSYVLETEDSDEDLSEGTLKSHNNHIYFYCDVDTSTILELNFMLKQLSDKLLVYSIHHDCDPAPIFLHVNSDGGDIFAALSAVDTIRSLKVPVHSIIEGCAASAATLISVVCDKRVITKNSHMLIHQLSSSFWGKMNEIEDEMQNLNRLMKVIKGVYKDYTNINQTKLSTYLRKDLLWCSETCLNYGLVDEISQ